MAISYYQSIYLFGASCIGRTAFATILSRHYTFQVFCVSVNVNQRRFGRDSFPLAVRGFMTSSSAGIRANSRVFPLSLLVGILLIAANLRAPITSLGPVLSELQSAFGLSQTQSGLLNALPLLIFAIASPFVPRLSRSIGLERALFLALWLIMGGCIFRSSGFFSALWLGTGLIGSGIAVANVLVVPIVKRDFPHHTALCVGLYAATMAMLAAVASGISAPLSTLTTLSWKFSLGIWCALALSALIAWWPHSKRDDTHVVESLILNSKRPSLWRSAVAWQVSMFMALQTLVFYTLIDWFPSMVSEVGISPTQAGACLFAYQAVAVVANLITSVVIKRFNDQCILGFICSLAIIVGILGLILNPARAIWWLIFAGIGAGMSMVTCLTLFGLRSRDHHETSALSGMAQCVGYGLGAMGPFLAGWMHDISGGWRAPLLALLVVALAQMVFATLAGRKRYV
ncbi:CP family cyanate transporter-like MFS transporter [Pseudomonas duriflava]|uniref:CP family cyanate transporter-like MFS transporter n=2 Tax=Pseudomonas duriflava TaxID=459528 RepID=A0A562PL01_9PSED|nr:CP family cyanate transporter-like MFS transporter [Pseudomonas duriflava]